MIIPYLLKGVFMGDVQRVVITPSLCRRGTEPIAKWEDPGTIIHVVSAF